MTGYDPEFEARITRNNAIASDVQIRHLAESLTQLRDLSELVVDPPHGVHYDKVLWRGFDAAGTHLTCGLIFPKREYPSLYVQTETAVDHLSQTGLSVFRIEAARIYTHGLFNRPNYRATVLPMRFKRGQESPDRDAFDVFSNPSPPKKENRLLGFFGSYKYNTLPIVKGGRMAVERCSQLGLLLDTVIEVVAPPAEPDER